MRTRDFCQSAATAKFTNWRILPPRFDTRPGDATREEGDHAPSSAPPHRSRPIKKQKTRAEGHAMKTRLWIVVTAVVAAASRGFHSQQKATAPGSAPPPAPPRHAA